MLALKAALWKYPGCLCRRRSDHPSCRQWETAETPSWTSACSGCASGCFLRDRNNTWTWFSVRKACLTLIKEVFRGKTSTPQVYWPFSSSPSSSIPLSSSSSSLESDLSMPKKIQFEALIFKWAVFGYWVTRLYFCLTMLLPQFCLCPLFLLFLYLFLLFLKVL